MNLSWVTQGRATPGTGGAFSQPSAFPLQELPPAPHPVPALPRGSPPSTAVSSPGSKQLFTMMSRPYSNLTPACLFHLILFLFKFIHLF